MTRSKRDAREQRIQAMICKYEKITSPPLNPQAYWSAKNYSTNPQHVDWRDPRRYNRTRLHDAARRGDLGEVQRLVEVQGANPFVKDNNFCLPARDAREEGHLEVAEDLRRKMEETVRKWKQYERTSGRRYRYRIA
jgi:hypothetical protein